MAGETRAAGPAIRLHVASARPEDVGKGVARLGRHALDALGLEPGDVVEIQGKRLTAARALRGAPEDEELDIVRLDGLGRANAGVGLGDPVLVRRAEVRPARRVTLAPAQPHVRLRGTGEALRRTLQHRPLVAGDTISTSAYQRTPPAFEEGLFSEEFFRRFFDLPAYALHELRLRVVSTAPRGVVEVAPDTEIELLPEYVEPEEVRRADVTYDDIGGLGDALDQIREMVELPLKRPELFERLGIDPPKGVLLHGPPGTGKTLIARAVANEADARFFHIGGPEIMGRYYGEAEERLRDVFQQAAQQAPAIIFIDELDSIAQKRAEVTGEVERRVVAQLLTLMDGLEPRQHVVVIGATNRPESIDEALRRPGRFDREIAIGVPDTEGRRQILAIHTRGMPLAEDVDLDELARITHGFVGADLAALAREAAIETLRRTLAEAELDPASDVPPALLERLRVTMQDFQQALRRVQPSALREVMIEVPDVRWDDVGGAEEAKERLREGVELPLKNPAGFRRLGIRPAKGFLLYGPPGTGKTLLAKAVARESEANFISVKSSDLLSKWYGESEQQISRLFRRARQVAPVVVFLDELEAIAPLRGGGLGEPAATQRVVNTILAEMDGIEELQGVVVIGATNRPTLIDPALLRPGRFDELIYVPVPDRDARLQILRIHTRAMPLAPDVQLEALADRTEGYTGADLEDLTRRAGLHALRADPGAREVAMRHFERALQEVRPSVSPEIEREYRELARRLRPGLAAEAGWNGRMAAD